MNKYKELEPLLRSERFQYAIITELVELNRKLDILLKKNEPETIEIKPATRSRKKKEVAE